MIPGTITTEDALREWVLDQGINWWDFVLTPEYQEWFDVTPNAKKATVHVKPYIREGHLVRGYDQQRELADQLDSIRREFGRPLGLPMVEQRAIQDASIEGRADNQIQEITRKLRALPNGSEIELAPQDIGLLAFGPEGPGLRPSPGKYRRVTRMQIDEFRTNDDLNKIVASSATMLNTRDQVEQHLRSVGFVPASEIAEPFDTNMLTVTPDMWIKLKPGNTGRWSFVERIGMPTPEGIVWHDRLKPTSRTPRDGARGGGIKPDVPLTDGTFAESYRGALLRPLSITLSSFAHPYISDEEVEQWFNSFDDETTLAWNDKIAAEYPSDGATEPLTGTYVKRADGWHYFKSLGEMYGDVWGEPGNPGPWPGLGRPLTNREMRIMMAPLARDAITSTRDYQGYEEEQKIYTDAQGKDGPPQTDLYRDGAPGDLYRGQHALILEAGRILDEDLQRRLTDLGVPSQAVFKKVEADVQAAAKAQSESAAKQRAIAEDVAFPIFEAKIASSLGLKDYKLPREDQRLLSLGEDGMYHAPESRVRSIVRHLLLPSQAPVAQAMDDLFDSLELHRPVGAQQDQVQIANEVVPKIDAAIREAVIPTGLDQDYLEKTATYNEVGATRKALQESAPKLRRQAVLETLAANRAMGGDLTITNPKRTPGIQTVLDAAKYLPADWIAASNRYRNPKVRTKKGARAKYTPLDGVIQTDGTAGTSLHELVHHMERAVPALDAAQWMFWQRRARDNDLTKPQPNPKWIGIGRRKEVGVKDEFKAAYAGKVYGGGSPGNHWEILTMGLPALYSIEYTNVVWDDEDYRRFVLGVLGLV